MRNDFEEERDQEEEELAFLKTKKSSDLEPESEDEETEELARDDDVFESVEDPFADSEETESSFALYSSEEDDYSLQF